MYKIKSGLTFQDYFRSGFNSYLSIEINMYYILNFEDGFESFWTFVKDL